MVKLKISELLFHGELILFDHTVVLLQAKSKSAECRWVAHTYNICMITSLRPANNWSKPVQILSKQVTTKK